MSRSRPRAGARSGWSVARVGVLAVGRRRVGGVVPSSRPDHSRPRHCLRLHDRLREHRPRPGRRPEDRGAAHTARVPVLQGRRGSRDRTTTSARLFDQVKTPAAAMTSTTATTSSRGWGPDGACGGRHRGGRPAGVVVAGERRGRRRGDSPNFRCRTGGGTAADGAATDSSSPAGPSTTGGRCSGRPGRRRPSSGHGRRALSDDADFQHWTDETGGGGIATLYVARFGRGPGAGTSSAVWRVCGVRRPTTSDALDSFRGMAATLRFSDGSLELEMAGGSSDAADVFGDGRAGDDLVATLPPATRAAAVGVGPRTAGSVTRRRRHPGRALRLHRTGPPSGRRDIDRRRSRLRSARTWTRTRWRTARTAPASRWG